MDTLAQVWDFKALLGDNRLPIQGRGMHNLDPVHAFRFTRSDGIYMQWKQWCTDESWSRPIQLLAPHEIPAVAAWRPAQQPMEFKHGEKDPGLAQPF